MLSDKPDIVVGTPARALSLLQSKVKPILSLLASLLNQYTFIQALDLTLLESLVIDEADLILSYGHDQDVRTILSSHVPKVFQSFLMSATMTEDVELLKGLALRSPVRMSA